MIGMTGYANSSINLGRYSVSFEIKSLNSKSFDIQFDLPDELSFFETIFRKYIISNVSRGTIRVKVIVNILPDKKFVDFDWDSIRAFYDFYQIIISKFNLDDKISISDILSNKSLIENNVINLKDYHLDLENEFKKVVYLLLDLKKDEGNKIQEIVLGLIDEIKVYINNISLSEKSVVEKNTIRIKNRVLTMVGDGFDEQRLLMEISLMASKLDFKEEIERFIFHLNSFTDLCSARNTFIGKKLEFILQEMFREINTLSVKANDIAISSLSVEIKSCIEKIKEQIRNIE